MKMEQSYERYSSYEAEMFLMDEYFISSHQEMKPADKHFWDGFLAAYPERAVAYKEAMLFLERLNFTIDLPDQTSANRVWNRVLARAKEKQPAKLVVMTSGKRRSWTAVAAVFLLSIAGWFFYQQYVNTDVLVQTHYGEKKQLVLPDNSMVVLNANSSIRYKKSWNGNKVREVWVEGEAYLDVVHINEAGRPVTNHERFIVHMNDADVEVLGTSFTVKQRGDEGQVVLEKGKVKVSVKNEASPVMMVTGDLVAFNTQTRKLELKKTIQPEKYIGWRESKYQFDATPVSEIVKMIEDNYGYKVRVTDPELLNRTVSGRMSSEDQAIFFKQLENAMGAQIEIKEDSTLIIRAF